MAKFINGGTIIFDKAPSIASFAAAVGPKEGEGPLREYFDYIAESADIGAESWEKAESELQKIAFKTTLTKSAMSEKDISFMFAGDLLNQCTGTAYGMRDFDVPFVGLYGACSTMAESLIMASIFVEAGMAVNTAAITSSHFCSAERQFRFPVNYGGQRTPTAQWTATAAGCAIVNAHKQPPYIKAVTIGKISDMGIKDANNMGAAMADAAYQTITTHLINTNSKPEAYDLILTGDLGKVGSALMMDLFLRDEIYLSKLHNDCGLMLYDLEEQDVHAGASGCGCSASVLCGKILNEVASGKLKNVLFVATGALMSPTAVQQGESIPSVAHAVHISAQ